MENVEPNKMVENGMRDEGGKFVSGHPPIEGAGRPPFSLVAILREELQKVPEGQKETFAKLLIIRMLKEAIENGNDAQIKNILQYIEGMPKQSIDMKHEGKLTLEEFLSDDTSEKGINKE